MCGAAAASVIFGNFLHWCCRWTKKNKDIQDQQLTASPSALSSSSNPRFKSDGDVDTTGIDSGDDSIVLPMILSWENVTYVTRQGADEKMIIKDAVGICSPRTLTAVLGPSGAGKSSLIDILSFRARMNPAPGSKILVNGLSPKAFPALHQLIGYVPQDDVLYEHLTVLETLQFASQLILPATMNEQAKVDRMLRLVAQLGIGHILDTRVGGVSSKGVSGGEKRRITIALQMLKSPSILFLDEPTSGLDASRALKICKVLRELANEGRTIFSTIHQPSAACFELFDRVILLSGGLTVYSGTRTGSFVFFKENQREIPYNWNPADWLITVVDYDRDERIVQKDGQAMYKQDSMTQDILRRKGIKSVDPKFKSATNASALNLDVSELRESVNAYYQQVNPTKLVSDPNTVEEIVTFTLNKGVEVLEQKLMNRYKVSFYPFLKQSKKNYDPCTKEQLQDMVKNFYASRYSSELTAKIQRAKEDARRSIQRLPANSNASFILRKLDNGNNNVSEMNIAEIPTYSQPFMHQVRLLVKRSLVLVWRNPQAIKLQVLESVLFGLLLGSLYSNVDFLQNSPYQDTISTAIILATNSFTTIGLGANIAFSERLVFEREMADAMYSPLAQFFQRLFLLPVSFFYALSLIIPSYFWIGLRPSFDSFIFFCLVNFAIVFVFDSVVFTLTMFFNELHTVVVLANFYQALTIFFSGVFIPVYLMPVYYRWVYFLSPFSYAFGAIVVDQFEDTSESFAINLTGVVLQNSWASLMVVIAFGLLWRFIGLYGIIRMFRKKKPGNLVIREAPLSSFDVEVKKLQSRATKLDV